MDSSIATFIVFIVLWLIVIALRSAFSSSKKSVLDEQNNYSMYKPQVPNEPMTLNDERCGYCGSKYVDNNICPNCGGHICHICNKCRCK